MATLEDQHEKDLEFMYRYNEQIQSKLDSIKKNGDIWGLSTHPEHGIMGSRFLEQFKLREPAKTEIKNCVRYHMGRFTGTKEDIERGSNPNKKELIVEMTDMFCSRKYASWLPGIDVKDEDIQNFLNRFKTEI